MSKLPVYSWVLFTRHKGEWIRQYGNHSYLDRVGAERFVPEAEWVRGEKFSYDPVSQYIILRMREEIEIPEELSLVLFEEQNA